MDKNFGAIIAAIIGAIALVIVAILSIWHLNYFDIDLIVHNERGDPLRAIITLEMPDKTEKRRETDNKGNYRFVRLKNGNYTVTVNAKNYKEKTIEFDRNDSNRAIELKEIPELNEKPFSLRGWSTWGGITVSSTELHTIVVNGNVQVAGYVNERIDTAIAGKTLILEVANSGKSTFNRERMFKLVYNPEDKLLKPHEIPALIESEYIPASDGRFTFTIPQDFSGKLQFVFFQPTLNDLTISAWL